MYIYIYIYIIYVVRSILLIDASRMSLRLCSQYCEKVCIVAYTLNFFLKVNNIKLRIWSTGNCVNVVHV